MTAPTLAVDSDPRRWRTLAIVAAVAFVIVMDTSALTVALPTIREDLDSGLTAIQWVISGYSLTFASFLLVGGRLGDLYGHRRLFIIGCSCFATGSAIAAISPSVGWLIVGEAIVEGVGASMMLPATTAIISRSFSGPERSTAFGIWGATAGAAAAFGPVFGGFVTDTWSWRWMFVANIVVAGLATVGAWFVIRSDVTTGSHNGVDVVGSLLVAAGAFSALFALSQSGRYGMWRPLEDFAFGDFVVWPDDRPIAISVAAVVAAVAVLGAFSVVESRKEAGGGDPLLSRADFRDPVVRRSIVTVGIWVSGHGSLLFVLPLVLQDVHGLSPRRSGLWIVPLGCAILAGAQIGARAARRFGLVPLLQVVLFGGCIAMAYFAVVIDDGTTFWRLLPGFALYGACFGAAASQFTNLILGEVPLHRSGVVSGANSTGRQIGQAFGVALTAAILSATTVERGAQTALLAAAAVMVVGALSSLRIPAGNEHLGTVATSAAVEVVEGA